MKRKIVPDIVQGQELWTLPPATNLQVAVEHMAERRIGAVMIVQGGKLTGIFSERDLLTRVVAKGRDPKNLMLSEVMTADPITVKPNDTASAALDLMRDGGFRHLPVAEADGKPVGMVSIRDLYAAVAESLREELEQRDEILFGAGYGGR